MIKRLRWMFGRPGGGHWDRRSTVELAQFAVSVFAGSLVAGWGHPALGIVLVAGAMALWVLGGE